MIYPADFEAKIGFPRIRAMLREACMSTLGEEKVDSMQMMYSTAEIREKLVRVSELRLLLAEREDFPLTYYFDMRQSVSRLRIENTHLDERELFDLRRSLDTIHTIKTILVPAEFRLGDEVKYPHLQILAEEVSSFPEIVRRIDGILDKYGRLRDTASPELQRIRRELKQAEGSVSRTLYNILRQAQQDGLVDKDAAPTLRDGRLVIPVSPAMKRRIPGIVHDESATGKTAYVEPTEVVEANNKLRALEADEKKETVRILTEFAKVLRPDARYIAASYDLLAHIDFLRAKLIVAEKYGGIEPEVADRPLIDWVEARHPLLQETLEKAGRKIVPLDISLSEEGRILVISGPNAGGKSVCLETAGLLQYMLQCGLPVPIKENSRCGVFSDIMLDIGDEQSIENDLSTYSSHLRNMNRMMRSASPKSLMLIDEFGAGTEPQIGGAIAEAILTRLWEKGTFAVITTHYQNLKHFADNHEAVVNGAMLYDRNRMQALFQLQIGRPGSSFAIEIARQTGVPEDVIQMAADIVGQDYIQADKYLQDIVRDKRYWEAKRQTIRQREKDMQRTIDRYETSLADIERQRKDILRRAKEQAEEILQESNRRIENTIREIREQQAEKEAVKKIREELDTFRQEVQDIDTKSADDAIQKKIEQITARRERQQKRKAERQKTAAAIAKQQPEQPSAAEKQIVAGDSVRMRGHESVGTVEKTDGKTATVIFGDMRTKVPLRRLEKADNAADNVIKSDTAGTKHTDLNTISVSRATRATIDEHRKAFRQEIDVRGMRGDEAMNAVMYFIDDAILAGVSQVRILHGKGDGILRQIIRDYLATVPGVTAFRDEHVQFGGAGITVVDFE
ncbi:MAG: Smr/MutS family protein [Prevotella sp.]|nr:Smr/MutS family protein [Prevotella sp.]